MALVVMDVVIPVALRGQPNGRLPTALLRATPGLAGGPTVRLCEVAMRAWLALSGAASAANIVLKATSLADSYRTYDVQRSTFLARFQRDRIIGAVERRWDSDSNGVAETWYLKPGEALAAVPGTSNHGLGLAVDIANASGARLTWMEAHALGFGWSWEAVPSEPWHLHYFPGDVIPAAVLAFEEEHMADYGSLGPPPNVPDYVDQHPDIMAADMWAGITQGRTGWGSQADFATWWIAKRFATIESQLAQVLSTLSGITSVPGGGATPAQVRQIVDEELDEQSRAGADNDA